MPKAPCDEEIIWPLAVTSRQARAETVPGHMAHQHSQELEEPTHLPDLLRSAVVVVSVKQRQHHDQQGEGTVDLDPESVQRRERWGRSPPFDLREAPPAASWQPILNRFLVEPFCTSLVGAPQEGRELGVYVMLHRQLLF